MTTRTTDSLNSTSTSYNANQTIDVRPSTSFHVGTEEPEGEVFEDNMLTIEDFRTQKMAENPGYEYIDISRDNYIEKLFAVYKNPNFNYFRKPKVEFRNEPGNAITILSLALSLKLYMLNCRSRLGRTDKGVLLERIDGSDQ